MLRILWGFHDELLSLFIRGSTTASRCPILVEPKIEPLAALAYKTNHPCRITKDQTEVGHIPRYHSAGPHQRITANLEWADQGGVRTDAGAFSNQGPIVLFPICPSARNTIVGEYHIGTYKAAILYRNASPQGDRVFDDDVVPYLDATFDKAVVTDIAVAADRGAL